MNDLNQDNRNDIAAKVARSVVGVAPFIGQLLCEIVNEIIPNQKIDRLIRFVEILDKKVSTLQKESIKQEFQKEECTDFLEEGLRQASRALSEERKEYIATLIANGLSSKDISYNESKHLLRILSEINDIEIIWLRFYLVPTIKGDEEFRKKHEVILKRIAATLTATQEIRDKEALQNSYLQHLVQLGLLKNQYGRELRFNSTPEDILEITGHEITPLGKLLLLQIGLDIKS